MGPALGTVDPSAMPALKVADHQVAGHRFEDGRVGSLVDDSGRFYKPLQDGARGDKEVLFYNRFWSDTTVPPAIQKFFPKFYGTAEIDSTNTGVTVKHAIMENLSDGFQKPGIMDVKVGARTWYIEAGPKYVEKCKAKDKETTTEALGYRVSGMQVYKAKNAEVWKAPRKWCKDLKPEDVPDALKRFVSSNPSAESGWDGAFAKNVYGATLTELQELKAWLEVQTSYHFYSASVLLVYEGEPTCPQTVSVRLVDFAHVLYDRDTIDENTLSGLNAFMQRLTDIIESVQPTDIVDSVTKD
jgi:1D-myo-inositol-tetrakisphosphate 5-kinase/inositol-polyphosphate multikinase